MWCGRPISNITQLLRPSAAPRPNSGVHLPINLPTSTSYVVHQFSGRGPPHRKAHRSHVTRCASNGGASDGLPVNKPQRYSQQNDAPYAR